MGRHTNKEDKIDKKGLKQVLGRIFRPRHPEENEVPFLIIKERQVKVRLDHVIQCILNNPNDDDTCIVGYLGRQYCIHGVSPADVEIVRAYIHRFGPDVVNPLSIEAHPTRRLLLDENTPQPAMLHLSKCFGWATHVAAEGLAGRNTPDEDIWDFACQYGFETIVTCDTDFLEIQERRAQTAKEDDIAVPLLVFVDGNTNTESLTTIFSSHKHRIDGYIRNANCLAISVTENGDPKPLF